MFDDFVLNVFKPIVLAFFVIIAYVFGIGGGIVVAYFVGFREQNMAQFVAMIVGGSGIAFITTLIIHYLFQLIPFLGENKFIKNYFAMHLLILYVSGLIAAITSIEPLLMEMNYITKPIDNDQIMIIYLVFFMILANYNLYNVIIIQNKFDIYKTVENNYLKLKQIIILFSMIFGIILMVRLLVLGFDNQLTFLLGMILIAPYMIKKIFFSRRQAS